MSSPRVGDHCLWDYCSEQYIVHGVTGEVVAIHGPRSAIHGGPFCLQSLSGEGVIVGLDGDDATKELHETSDLFRTEINSAPREGFLSPQLQVCIKGFADGRTAWLDVARLRYDAKVLVFQIRNCVEFKSEVYWWQLGIALNGVRPVKLWLSMPWILHFLYPVIPCLDLWRRIRGFRDRAVNYDMDPNHFMDSVASKHMQKRLWSEVEDAGYPPRAWDVTPEFSCTAPGLLLMLTGHLSDGRYVRGGMATATTRLIEKAAALITHMFDAVLVGRDVVFRFDSRPGYTLRVQRGQASVSAVSGGINAPLFMKRLDWTLFLVYASCLKLVDVLIAPRPLHFTSLLQLLACLCSYPALLLSPPPLSDTT